MSKKRKHLLVLTDLQLGSVLHALTNQVEDALAGGEDLPRVVKIKERLSRQRVEGLSQDEQIWAMEEIVRLSRGSVPRQERR